LRHSEIELREALRRAGILDHHELRRRLTPIFGANVVGRNAA
jgi:hypothetical protein